MDCALTAQEAQDMLRTGNDFLMVCEADNVFVPIMQSSERLKSQGCTIMGKLYSYLPIASSERRCEAPIALNLVGVIPVIFLN